MDARSGRSPRARLGDPGRCGGHRHANLADFPAGTLASYHTEAKHPDDFVLETIDLAPALVVQVLVEPAGALTRPPCTVEDLLQGLHDAGLARSVARVRELRGLPAPGDERR